MKIVGGVKNVIGGLIDMYKVVRIGRYCRIAGWQINVDLTDYYKRAKEKGFVNNASREMLIDCFDNESQMHLFLLYEDDTIIGTQVLHTFPEMGPNCWRVGRTSLLVPPLGKGKSIITKFQNHTDQFLHPAVIKFVSERKGELYSTTNMNPEAKQNQSHLIYFPLLEKMGVVDKVGDMEYRYTNQTVWKFNFNRFWELYNLFPKWN